MHRRLLILSGLALLAAAILASIEPVIFTHTSSTSSQQWVDEARCQQCHASQFDAWRGSHHQQAMQPATEETVLGDFNNTSFKDDQETSLFFRKGDEFWIRTPDASGEPGEFRVAYTFGLTPLQQYLLELDDGHLQAFGVAWDTDQQRWFSLYPNKGINAHHALHWSKPTQNANTQCIECHVTGFQPGYDVNSDRFDSQWHSLGVGCQACHGPAGEHLRWAQAPDNTPSKGLTHQLDQSAQQLNTCGTCHSRRSPVATPEKGFPEDSTVLHDDYLLSQLTAELYEVDGTIQGEVFEHGSFLQSRMQQAGVVCADCHDPHSGQLRAPDNAVCTQCHNPTGTPARNDIRRTNLEARDYDSPAHHHHEPGSPGAQCQACHMPGKLYMGNDLRHDHSFSIPDPKQARALGHSDACLGCHHEQDTGSLIKAFKQWYPDHRPRDGGFAAALFKARHGQPGAATALHRQLARDDLPALRRAALVAELANYPSPDSQRWLIQALQHADAMVRRAALNNAPSLLDAHQLQHWMNSLSTDPRRSVRIAAAEQQLALADQQGTTIPMTLISEYEQLQKALPANAEAHFNLANLYRLTSRNEQVMPALQTARRLNPEFSPAIVLLAQWQEQHGDRQASRELLEQQLRQHPDNAVLHHALGLARIRAGQPQAGIASLEQAQQLAPDNDTYSYVLAVAWYDTGKRQQALALLRQQLQRHPANRSLQLALIRYLPAGSERNTLINDLRQQNPQDPLLQQLQPHSLTEDNTP